MSSKAKKLEEIELEETRRAREAAERARDEVVESAGRLLDQAREDPEVEVDERNPAVRELAKKTGRSGQIAAVRPAAGEKPS